PCVKWYGETYPFSSLYERNPGVSGAAVRDAAYMAEPSGGWYTALANLSYFDPLTLNQFQVQQQGAGSVFGYDPAVASALVGTKPKQGTVASVTGGPAFVNASSSTGLLGTIPTRYYANFVVDPVTYLPSVTGLQPQPWYNLTDGGDNAIDDAISAALKEVFLKIAAIPKDAILSGNASQTNLLYSQINEILRVVPYGGIYFTLIDHASKKYSYNFHYGSDLRLGSASTFPAAGQRYLLQQTQLSNAILRNSNAGLNSAQITQGLRIFPQVASSKISLEFGSIIGGILFPFGISFLLPIFTIVLVQEK
ncbi:hypothetical protein HDU91_004374, partial [Kappamyces sp. JEL0680]